MLYVFFGLILAFILWNASMKMLLILILLLVLFIAFYTTPLNRAFEFLQDKNCDEDEYDESEEEQCKIYIKRTPDRKDERVQADENPDDTEGE